MADLALTACKLLALQVYEKAKLAIANKEDCTQLARYISGLQPMMEELEGSQIASGAAQKSLEFLRDTLQEALDLITRCCGMGWMKALVKASNIKGEFSRITLALERALAGLPMANLAISDRVRQGIFALRADLTDAKFQMVAMQEALVTEMRKQAERARLDDTRITEMHEMMHKLMSRATGDSLKKSSRDVLKREIEELRAEQELMRQEKDRQEEYFLEQMIVVLGGSMLLAKDDSDAGKENRLAPTIPAPNPDLPRISVPEGVVVPRQFLCPISREIMADPVMLVATGKTYDRCYIEEWFDRGNKTCPATGQAVPCCQLAPNIDFRSAVEAWVAAVGSHRGPTKSSSSAGKGSDDGPKEKVGSHQAASTRPWTATGSTASRSALGTTKTAGGRRSSKGSTDAYVRASLPRAPPPRRSSGGSGSGIFSVCRALSPSRSGNNNNSLASQSSSGGSRSSAASPLRIGYRGSVRSPSPQASLRNKATGSPSRPRSRAAASPARSSSSSSSSSSSNAKNRSAAASARQSSSDGASSTIRMRGSWTDEGNGVSASHRDSDVRSSLPALLMGTMNTSWSSAGSKGPRWSFLQGPMRQFLRRVSRSSQDKEALTVSDFSDAGTDSAAFSSTNASSCDTTGSSLGSVLCSVFSSPDSSIEGPETLGAGATDSLIPAMIHIIKDRDSSPPDDRQMAMEVLRDITLQGNTSELSRPLLRAQGVSVLARVLAETDPPCGLVAQALAVLGRISADSSCLASILAEGIPANVTRLLKSEDSEEAAAAAVLVAKLCRLGGAAASAVDVDSIAILSLVRMLQDGSSLEARAAAGCAIEELMKGSRKNKMVIEKANGVTLLVELLRLGVSGGDSSTMSSSRGVDAAALSCIALSAAGALKGLAADSTANQAAIGGTSGLMRCLVALMAGAAGERGQQAAVELLHRLVARVESNRGAFFAEPGAAEALVDLLGGYGAGDASASSSRADAVWGQIACDASWVVGILSTWGAREELCRLGAKGRLKDIKSSDASYVTPEVKASADFALRSL